MRLIPGPPLSSFLFGYMLMILNEPFFAPQKRWWYDYRKKHDGSSPPFIAYNNFLGSYSLFVFDPDIVKIVLTDPAHRDPIRFVKNYSFLKSTIGLGLVTLEGSAWNRHRRLIQPSFQNVNFLKCAITQHVNEVTNHLISAWMKRNSYSASSSNKKNLVQTIDVASHMSAVTLDVIGAVAFSYDFGTTRSLDKWAESAATITMTYDTEDPFIESWRSSMKLTFLTIILSIWNLSWLEPYINPKAARTKKLLNDTVDAVIKKARQDANQTHNNDKNNNGHNGSNNNIVDSNTNKYPTKSLLQLLFDVTLDDEATGTTTNGTGTNTTQLSNIELRDEVKTFLIAGHETTSTWCYWALYAMAIHPNMQQKVYDNIIQHTSSSNNQASETATSIITIDEIDHMDYLSVFMTEVLRLYSPVGLVFRFTTRKEVWYGYTIPAHTRVIIPIHLLNRHPDHFNNPEEFIPERWMDKEECNNRHKFAFIPFSAGGRNCIGQRFAEMEAKLIIAKICRAFKIRLAPCMDGKEITFSNFISMKSKPLIQIEVDPR